MHAGNHSGQFAIVPVSRLFFSEAHVQRKHTTDGHTAIKAKQTFTCRTSQIVTFKGPICNCNMVLWVEIAAVATLLALFVFVYCKHVFSIMSMCSFYSSLLLLQLNMRFILIFASFLSI